MARGTQTERAMRNIAELRLARGSLTREQRARIDRVIENLREETGPTVPKMTAARVLGISRTTLDKRIAKGEVPVGPGPSSREEVLRAPLEALATDALSYRQPARAADGHRTVERQSSAFNLLIAGRLDEQVRDRALRTVGRWEKAGTLHSDWARRWRELLARPLDEIREVITADTQEGRDMRQTSPLIGVITQRERQTILDEVF